MNAEYNKKQADLQSLVIINIELQADKSVRKMA